MTKQQSAKEAATAGRGILRIALVLFLLFFANVLIGKGNITFQWTLPHLEGVAEFLLLGLASTTLIWAALQREAAENENSNQKVKEV